MAAVVTTSLASSVTDVDEVATAGYGACEALRFPGPETVKRSVMHWPSAPAVLLWLLRQPFPGAGTSSYTAKTLYAFSVSSRVLVPQVFSMEDRTAIEISGTRSSSSKSLSGASK